MDQQEKDALVRAGSCLVAAGLDLIGVAHGDITLEEAQESFNKNMLHCLVFMKRAGLNMKMFVV